MDNVGNVGSRRRATGNSNYSAEEQALDAIAKEVNLISTILFIYDDKYSI